MADGQLSTLQQEWITLQSQFDQYEKYSLLIKLCNILITCYLLFALKLALWPLFICAVIWLQDGIWKTFQARTGDRLLLVEEAVSQLQGADNSSQPILGMQFNSAWESNRSGAIGLIMEYVKQSLKPTVAYPHVLLLILCLIMMFL
ncbi:hypothetical protein RS130_06225 [Paraglaciecola aquimarina]|uniref:Uncharacterized protein n=1 Tax=Paraglaciecola aquimarina TaxID=1235557 RepID=A0ABU3SU93_9ALTE|nr:hypothetical protein [Paraglaciecola aquimarina]MDU0353579.1 hypothetical protein [Paraglaciecola aquimarina]